ncbi:DUF4185 domain-containing protein [Streptomyces sedi]|uniref:DUF4185 domain-containing protein n=1 Tax=Streptomyces sedi TaxID=555059 RepID=A0A5C4V5G0_9ACTN|nr:DUF4185 domain-containing protein [Streptomyces sedi]TNM30319.1 DUF4185 domain-containing protein [Streptomyces sedi]
MTTEDADPNGAPGPSPARRNVLRSGLGLGLALGTGGIALASGIAASANASGASPGSGPSPRAVGGSKVRDLTGPDETGQFAAPWTDLGIPVRCPDGSILMVCGDTFDGEGVGDERNWRSPVGLRASDPDLSALVVDGAVGGAQAVGLVPEGHEGGTTAIPSDVFAIGDTLYMHLMRGVIFQTHHSDFWRSTDNGETWEYLCQWPGDQYGGQFQQKTYAVADDGYCYVLSSVFNRDIPSGLLLHRVRHESVGDPAAYEPWGYANGAWAWGNEPTTVNGVRRWGEIGFRAMEGRYILTWLNMEPLDIRAQIFDLPTSDLTATPEQPMILPTEPGQEHDNVVAHPYGGWVFPGSTFDDLHIAVSQWYDPQNYRVMQYRIHGLVT